jgi:putative transposase
MLEQMPRTARLVASGATYHLTALGTGSEAVFRTERDGRHFMTLLERVIQRHRWNCLVYCLMPTHYHLMVETPESDADLARGMHRLNGCYAQSFNRRQGRFGHLFAERFYSGMVTNDSHMLEVIRYVARNPVRAGLCSSPGEWRWSSYAASIGLAPPPPSFLALDALYRHFGRSTEAARRRLQAFVEDP